MEKIQKVASPPARASQRATVLFEPYAVVATKCKATPGKWYLVASGPKERLRVISQTAWRIRRGQLLAFSAPDDAGSWEAYVASSDGRESATDRVELYLRYSVDE
jgi:hypothetical protein